LGEPPEISPKLSESGFAGFKDFQDSREATSHPENPKIQRIMVQTAYRKSEFTVHLTSQ
jgi:hypothetical protein